MRTTPMMLTATLAAGLMLTGCSEETKKEVSEAASAVTKDVKETTSDAIETVKETSGEVIEKGKELADELTGSAEQAADEVAGEAETQVEEAKAAADGMLAKANESIEQIQKLIEGKSFDDAQALLDQLKETPGLDQLNLQDQLDSLQSLIDQGKKAGEALNAITPG